MLYNFFMKSKLALNLIKLRKKKGLSQKKLAEIAGISRGTVAYYENEESEKSHVENVQSLAKALGVKIEDLLSDSKKDNPNLNNVPQIDSRTMEKINLILSLPKDKRHILYVMVEALTKLVESNGDQADKNKTL